MSARVSGLRLCYIAVGTAVAAAAASSCFAAGSLGDLLACRRIEASAARLACFDRESGALAMQLSGAPTAPQSENLAAAPRSGAAAASHLAAAVAPQSAAVAAPQSAAPIAQQAPAAPQAQLNPRETFGFAPQQIAEQAEAAMHAPKPLDSLTGHISGITKAADGREIFVLDNRQVWVQLETNGDWLDAHPGEQVTISRGWLGSFRLSLPSHRGFKVTRVR